MPPASFAFPSEAEGALMLGTPPEGGRARRPVRSLRTLVNLTPAAIHIFQN